MIRLLVLTESTNVTDKKTDGRTPHDGIGHVYAQHHMAKIILLDICLRMRLHSGTALDMNDRNSGNNDTDNDKGHSGSNQLTKS